MRQDTVETPVKNETSFYVTMYKLQSFKTIQFLAQSV